MELACVCKAHCINGNVSCMVFIQQFSCSNKNRYLQGKEKEQHNQWVLILHHNKVKTHGILRERSYLLFDQLSIAKPINSAFRSQPNKDLVMH